MFVVLRRCPDLLFATFNFLMRDRLVYYITIPIRYNVVQIECEVNKLSDIKKILDSLIDFSPNCLANFITQIIIHLNSLFHPHDLKWGNEEKTKRGRRQKCVRKRGDSSKSYYIQASGQTLGVKWAVQNISSTSVCLIVIAPVMPCCYLGPASGNRSSFHSYWVLQHRRTALRYTAEDTQGLAGNARLKETLWLNNRGLVRERVKSWNTAGVEFVIICGLFVRLTLIHTGLPVKIAHGCNIRKPVLHKISS